MKFVGGIVSCFNVCFNEPTVAILRYNLVGSIVLSYSDKNVKACYCLLVFMLGLV